MLLLQLEFIHMVLNTCWSSLCNNCLLFYSFEKSRLLCTDYCFLQTLFFNIKIVICFSFKNKETKNKLKFCKIPSTFHDSISK